MIKTGIDQQDLNTLVAHNSWPAITITLSTARAGVEVQQGQIRLKNMLLLAEERLVEGMLRRTVAHDMLAEARSLVGDATFWNDRHDSIALFICEEFSQVRYLPFAVDDSLDISSGFNVLPILPAFVCAPAFNILVLEKHHLRLVHCAGDTAETVHVPHLHVDIELFAQQEKGADSHQQHVVANGRTVIGSGSGDPSAAESARLRRFYIAADHAVSQHLAPLREPLVLAGTKESQAIFRSVAKYANIVAGGIPLVSRLEKNEDLRKAALPLLESLVRSPVVAEVDRYRARAGTGMTSQQIEEILVAAHAGKVEALLVSRSEPIWGKFDDLTGVVVVNDTATTTDENLVNRAALGTLRHKGYVFPVDGKELELAASAVAVFRF